MNTERKYDSYIWNTFETAVLMWDFLSLWTAAAAAEHVVDGCTALVCILVFLSAKLNMKVNFPPFSSLFSCKLFV